MDFFCWSKSQICRINIFKDTNELVKEKKKKHQFREMFVNVRKSLISVNKSNQGKLLGNKDKTSKEQESGIYWTKY